LIISGGATNSVGIIRLSGSWTCRAAGNRKYIGLPSYRHDAPLELGNRVVATLLEKRRIKSRSKTEKINPLTRPLPQGGEGELQAEAVAEAEI